MSTYWLCSYICVSLTPSGDFIIECKFRTNPEAAGMLRVSELSVRKKDELYNVDENFDINPDFGSIRNREKRVLS